MTGLFSETIGAPERWVEDAICAQVDPEMFFPEKSGSGNSRKAKLVCQKCPVRQECLDYSLRTKQQFGVWGGFSEGDRREWRRRGRPLTIGPLMCSKGLHELTHETTFESAGSLICRACAQENWKNNGVRRRERLARERRGEAS